MRGTRRYREEERKREKCALLYIYLIIRSRSGGGRLPDGKRVREHEETREIVGREEGRGIRAGIDRASGIRTYLQIHLARFYRAGKLKGQTMCARYPVRIRWTAVNLMISSYSCRAPSFLFVRRSPKKVRHVGKPARQRGENVLRLVIMYTSRTDGRVLGWILRGAWHSQSCVEYFMMRCIGRIYNVKSL